MKTLLTVVIAIVLAWPSNARADEGGPGFQGVKMTGTGCSPLVGDVTGTGVRLRVTYSSAQTAGSGFFDCRPIDGWPKTCPAAHAAVSVGFGRADVIGDVSTMTIHATLPDGGSCDFSGVTPLPVGTPGTPFHISSPLVSVSGTYSCMDANGGPTKTGNFFAEGSPLRLPKCHGGQNDPVCLPPF